MAPNLPRSNAPQPQPIIYQNGKPSFENSPNGQKTPWDFDLAKKLLELNAGLLLLIFLVGAGIGGMILFSKPSKSPQAVSVVVADQGSQSEPDQPKIAASNQKSPIFINDQVISIDKAFNSNPSQIKLTVNGALKKEVFGYLPYWVVDKLDQINTKLLTSVAYFGLEVGSNGDILKSGASPTVAQAWDTWQNNQDLIAFLRRMKAQRIKVYLTFKCFNNDNIEALLNNPQAQQNFINNALYQMSSKSLDGINIDFEYVGTPPPGIKDKFSILMSNLNKEMKRQYPKSVLTIATYASAAKVDQFFDVGLLSQNSDGLVIMGYDFHTPDSANAGAVAPMGGEGINLLDDIDAYLEKADPSKIILAVPYYGYDWPVNQKSASAAVISGDVNVLTYAEIADQTQKININWDDTTQTPWYTYFASGQNRVVHFENTRSLGIKYDLVNKKNLEGVGIWALGMDGRTTELEQLLADKFAN